MERLLDLFTTNTNISRQLLEQQMEKLNLEKENLIQKQKRQEEEKTIAQDTLIDSIKSIDLLEFKDKQVLINKLVKQINIDHKNVEIIWRF